MSDENDFRSHTEVLNARRRAAQLAKTSPNPDFGEGQRGEVILLKKTDEVIDPATIRKSGEVTRS